MGRLEVLYETCEELGLAVLAAGGVVVGQVLAATGEHFADRAGGEVAQLGDGEVAAGVVEKLAWGDEAPALEGIYIEGKVFLEGADKEMARIGDGVEVRSDPLGNEEVEDGQGYWQSLFRFEHPIEEAVFRVFVILGVSAESVLVEKHAVDHDAAFAG